jgi:hypothetical protein
MELERHYNEETYQARRQVLFGNKALPDKAKNTLNLNKTIPQTLRAFMARLGWK